MTHYHYDESRTTVTPATNRLTPPSNLRPDRGGSPYNVALSMKPAPLAGCCSCTVTGCRCPYSLCTSRAARSCTGGLLAPRTARTLGIVCDEIVRGFIRYVIDKYKLSIYITYNSNYQFISIYHHFWSRKGR